MDGIEFELGERQHQEELYDCDYNELNEIIQYIEYKILNNIESPQELRFYEYLKWGEYSQLDLQTLSELIQEIKDIRDFGY